MTTNNSKILLPFVYDFCLEWGGVQLFGVLSGESVVNIPAIEIPHRIWYLWEKAALLA